MRKKLFSQSPILFTLVLGSALSGVLATEHAIAKPPDWAPAWGYRCKESQRINPPGNHDCDRAQSDRNDRFEQSSFQLNMQRALYSLIQAQGWLNNANGDKGGHRIKAISLTQKAIQEVELGIQYDIVHSGNQNRQSVSRPSIQTSQDRSLQPNMQRALASLIEAKRWLEAATSDKGGHRVKALSLVNQAIQEVRLGIQYDK
jgi:hypothetical protein